MAFSIQRLSIARKRAALNKTGFAEALGVSLKTVTRWEQGKTVPDPEMLDRIGDVLDFPAAFFEGRPMDEPETASFRSYASMTAAMRDSALSAGAIGFLLSDWVEARFDLPAIDVPDLSMYEPRVAARALREEWCLGERPVSNMVHLLESRGTRIFSLAEDTVRVNAFSIWRAERPYVFLNTVKSAESSRFDAAHELAHLVLHQASDRIGRAAEAEANAFAARFLMPRGDVMANLPRSVSIASLMQTKKRWKVSLAALAYRLHKMGRITDWRYRELCIEMSKRGFTKAEPSPIERERSKVWTLVLKELWSERVTTAEIARDLAVPEVQIEGLIHGLVRSAPTSERPSSAREEGRVGLRVVGGSDVVNLGKGTG